jgi:subtilase family serine protease
LDVNDAIVSAQVVVKAASGKSLLDETTITRKNLQQVLPSETVINEVASALGREGFIVQASNLTLSISGKKSLFEKVFTFRLSEKKHNGHFYYVPNKKATIPAPLKKYIVAIIFSEPVESFG